MPTFSAEQVAEHASESSCWIIYNNKVYDVTTFVGDHPGGQDIVMQFAGTNVTNVMTDPTVHVHSDATHDLLNEYYIGDLLHSTDAPVPVTKPLVTTDEKEKFLDLRKPLFPQLWNATYSKKFYLEQVHRPRYVPYYVAYFSDPAMDVLSRTSWYMVPLIWIPFVVYQLWSSLQTGHNDFMVTGVSFSSGVFFWTLLEYCLHRFLFHLDDLLPDHPKALLVHFTLHGIHHHMPMDRLRLVMPPALTVLIGTPVIRLAHSVCMPKIAHGFVAGAFMGYILYDLIHYYLHHAQVFKIHFREMKRYHIAHHYKEYDSGFGITSKLWDYVFGTVLVMDEKKSKVL
ncbi:hypothetical protein CLU79DRAFT_692950 [Phycomyces nitens]|nr:hypothetical protein CLU79DRAFT_692950 [Phycomyces nitens]